MACSKCGASAQAGAKFCTRCGTALSPALSKDPLPAPELRNKGVSLWNPLAAGCWSLLFSAAFGAYLHSENWKALGEPSKASKALLWGAACIGVYAVAIMVPVVLPLNFFILVGWWFTSGLEQKRLVEQRFSVYVHRPWAEPVVAAVAAVFAYGFITAAVWDAALGRPEGQPRVATERATHDDLPEAQGSDTKATENASYDALVRHYENRYPQINPDSPRYDVAAVREIRADINRLTQGGYSAEAALKNAVNRYFTESASADLSALPVIEYDLSQDDYQPPEPQGCVIKPVMTDAEREACRAPSK